MEIACIYIYIIMQTSCKVYIILRFVINIIGTGYIPEVKGHRGHTCKDHLNWAYSTGKYDARKDQWYPEMKKVTGSEPKDASFEDFQREFKCKDVAKNDCNGKGLQFPLTCSSPPCNQCPTVGNVS